MEKKKTKNKNHRGSASQFFVAGELCRRGYAAVVTMGNTPNTDILCSNVEGNRFVHIQVKTFRPNDRTCQVGLKAEKYYGDNFFWVLGGIPESDKNDNFEYYVIPSKVMSEKVKKAQIKWENTPGKKGQVRNATNMRIVELPPRGNLIGWNIGKYLNRWDLIEDKLK